MTEFCIPPATNAEDLNKSITYALEVIDKKIKPLNLEIAIVPSLSFEFSELDNSNSLSFNLLHE